MSRYVTLTTSEEISQLLTELHVLQGEIAKLVGEIVVQQPDRAQDLVKGLEVLPLADYWLQHARDRR